MAQELLSWLQEMEAADDLQEAFDVAEVLSDVLKLVKVANDGTVAEYKHAPTTSNSQLYQRIQNGRTWVAGVVPALASTEAETLILL